MRYILIFGTISGAIVITVMTLGIVLGSGGIFASEAFGYLVMLVALSLIFVGIKRYRDVERGGVIGFGRGLAIGLGIAALAGVVYVAAWEGYLAATDYAFMEQYIAGAIESLRESGVSGAEFDRRAAELRAMGESYRNPLVRIPITFLEIFPVGLLVALVSAALLRNPRVLPAAR